MIANGSCAANRVGKDAGQTYRSSMRCANQARQIAGSVLFSAATAPRATPSSVVNAKISH